MKRTSLFLDSKTLGELRRAARQREVSVAALVREAVAKYLAEPSGVLPLPSVTGRFSSGKRNTSAHVDELLWRDPHA